MRDSAHAPISVHEVAQSLPARTYLISTIFQHSRSQ
ncbi:putative ISXo8 transposase [Xanthomonas oryzae pv. oryzae KACC 10331]|uniref:ISXo8 transposase n=2 Tax=Xanthomonas oryzae pv. oryzae TaxID=64187 RepID=Q05HZ5_XANOR|nr:putative ISXo8 transposase [Xanthomonas oryzae pv. oryzae KACC 10331]